MHQTVCSSNKSLKSVKKTQKKTTKTEKKTKIGLPQNKGKGHVVFKEVSLAIPSFPRILNKVSFEILPGQKVGMVGMVSSELNSIPIALYQSPKKGVITIDNEDLALVDIVKDIYVLQSEPVIYSNTLRRNLDILQKYSDSEIWDALEKVKLKDQLTSLNIGLDTEIEKLKTVSATSKQQLFLVQALIMKPKVIIVKESEELENPLETNNLHKLVLHNFPNSTVIFLASHPETIQDCEKIFYLEGGKIVEEGEPSELLKNASSRLSNLVLILNNKINDQNSKNNSQVIEDFGSILVNSVLNNKAEKCCKRFKRICTNEIVSVNNNKDGTNKSQNLELSATHLIYINNENYIMSSLNLNQESKDETNQPDIVQTETPTKTERRYKKHQNLKDASIDQNSSTCIKKADNDTDVNNEGSEEKYETGNKRKGKSSIEEINAKVNLKEEKNKKVNNSFNEACEDNELKLTKNVINRGEKRNKEHKMLTKEKIIALVDNSTSGKNLNNMKENFSSKCKQLIKIKTAVKISESDHLNETLNNVDTSNEIIRKNHGTVKKKTNSTDEREDKNREHLEKIDIKNNKQRESNSFFEMSETIQINKSKSARDNLNEEENKKIKFKSGLEFTEKYEIGNNIGKSYKTSQKIAGINKHVSDTKKC